ncbi:hypothetical protein MWU77_20195 [Rhodococcus sp. F64268]|uniref:hypothetical protein n=1 Tax=Rhodococcus sp. F64268 TaxID=2926402 RepID=UPI001FF5482C|nr:hypothetical protein [Rhodococcus sp. F64268]MCK0093102.1 hypothetical protein [Rhodococcus sp. F64268]
MPLDTRIAGDPEAIRTAGRWLEDSLGRGVDEAIDRMYAARGVSSSGWEGTAGEEFRRFITSDARSAEQFLEAIVGHARRIDDLAAQSQSVQTDLAFVRQAAREAGLNVDEWLIHEPGPSPPEPGALSPGASETTVLEHYNDISARERHRSLIEAYEAARTAVGAAKAAWRLAVESTRNVWLEVTGKWFFFLGNSVNGVSGALAVMQADTLRKQASFLAGEAQRYLDLARSGPPGTPASVIYRDLDLGKAFAHSADDALAAATRADGLARLSGVKLGGALAVAGVAYDIIATDKPVDQAIVSGAAGFGTSLAAGAATGAIVGSVVPVFGTAIGAVAGAGVGLASGLFVSGAVDAAYTNGLGDVSDAISAGFDAVSDTGAAVSDVVEGVWDELL